MFATSSLLVSQAHPMQKAFSLLALEKRPFLSFFYGPATCSTYTACGTPRCGWNHLRCFPSPRACLGSSAKPDEEQQLADLDFENWMVRLSFDLMPRLLCLRCVCSSPPDLT